MIFALFTLFSLNLILRFNDYVPGFVGFPVAEVTIPLLVVLWLLFEKKDFSLATDLLMPAFFCVVVAGYALTVWVTGTWGIARPLIPWVAMYFLGANLVHNQRRMRIFLAFLFAAALVLVAHSLQQFWNYDGFDDLSGLGWSGETLFRGRARYVGVMNDPNDLALFLVMMLPVALQLSTKGMALNQRLTGYLLCVPLLLGIYLTKSRGGFLAAGAVAALYAHRRWGWTRSAAMCAVFAVAVLAFGPSRLRETDSSDAASTQGRLDAWYVGLTLLKEHPLLGVGKDQFEEHNILTAHNSFVLCFAETGFAGYVLWFGLGAYALYGLRQVLKRTRPGTASFRQTSLLFDSLVAFFVAGFFLSRTYFILFPLFIGLAVARFKRARDDMREPAGGGDDEYFSDFKPGSPPLPELSWRHIGLTVPRLAALAMLSILGIYLITKMGALAS